MQTMRPAIGVLLGVLLLGGAATVAAQSQSAADSASAADPDRTAAAVAPLSAPAYPGLATAPDRSTNLLRFPRVLLPVRGQMRAGYLWQRPPSALGSHGFVPASAGRVVSRTASEPRGVQRLDRKLLPVPLLSWQRPGFLINTHGSMSINPSLVIGRRLSFLPDVFPGGRTFGVAVEMKLRLDRATASLPSPPEPRRPGFLSRVRSLVEKNRR